MKTRVERVHPSGKGAVEATEEDTVIVSPFVHLSIPVHFLLRLRAISCCRLNKLSVPVTQYQDCSESTECQSPQQFVEGGDTHDVDCLESEWTAWEPLIDTATSMRNTDVSCETMGCQGSLWR
eukprot:GHVQ01013417.1.p1 GENE.GHVQ01013417.1~~GHVQ01013417.1.p1  ORF type:complete len:123 (+),score=10.40 GHVQ01013417.1:362-730(+)